MEIKAKCRYDQRSITALTRMSFSKKSDPKRTLTTYFAVCFFFIAFAALFMIFAEFNLTMLISAVVLAVCLLFVCYSYFLLPKIQYKKMGDAKNVENEFIFREDSFTISSLTENMSGTSEFKYSVVYKIFETGEFFFIYQNKLQAFIVDKSTIENGTEEDLRKLLAQAVGEEKYVLCNY